MLAQDVEKVAKETGYNFSGVDAAKNDQDVYSICYSDFVMPLIKAVQELSKQNEEQQKEIDDLKKLVKSNVQASSAAKQKISAVSQNAWLQQNHPNPTASSTTIKYFIPDQTVSASIKITNTSGQELKSINLSAKNSGQVSVATNNLSAGVYLYSLIVDGKTTDTKTMVIAR